MWFSKQLLDIRCICFDWNSICSLIKILIFDNYGNNETDIGLYHMSISIVQCILSAFCPSYVISSLIYVYPKVANIWWKDDPMKRKTLWSEDFFPNKYVLWCEMKTPVASVDRESHFLNTKIRRKWWPTHFIRNDLLFIFWTKFLLFLTSLSWVLRIQQEDTHQVFNGCWNWVFYLVFYKTPRRYVHCITELV